MAARKSPPASGVGYDKYRSVADSNIVILVPKDVVPPFRFKAGGWELLESSVAQRPGLEFDVDRYRKLLAEATDENKRLALIELLIKERDKERLETLGSVPANSGR